MAFLKVFWIGTMVATCFLQIIGIFSPEWACDIDDSNYTMSSPSLNESCEIEGLFYSPGVLAYDILGLCSIALFGSLICTGVLMVRFVKYFNKDSLDDILKDKLEKGVSLVFLASQFLAGIANIICLVRYDVLGWSAVLFFTFGFYVFIALVLIAVCFCYCKNCLK